jgi:hypothetical protein
MGGACSAQGGDEMYTKILIKNQKGRGCLRVIILKMDLRQIRFKCVDWI